MFLPTFVNFCFLFHVFFVCLLLGFFGLCIVKLSHLYVNLFLSLTLFFLSKFSLLFFLPCLFSLLSRLNFDVCFSGILKWCGLVFFPSFFLYHTVSQQQHPVQTSSSAHT